MRVSFRWPFFTALFLMASSLTAKPMLIRDDYFNEDMEELAVPNFNAGEIGYFEGEKGINIRYGVFPAEDATTAVVIVGGYAEVFDKYIELIYNFNQAGYTVFTFDQRGLGGSDRILKCDKQDKTHIDSYKNYLLDLDKYVKDIVMPRFSGRLVGFAHSMGGGVMARYLELHNDVFSAVVLSSPMLEPATGDFPLWTAKALAKVGGALPILNSQFAPGQTPYDPNAAFENNMDTSSELRFEFYQKWRNDRLHLTNGGGTYRWINEAFKLSKIAVKEAKRAQTPIIIFQPTKDTFVGADGQVEFCDNASDCTIVPVAADDGRETWHSLFLEPEDVRTPYLYRILDFYEMH